MRTPHPTLDSCATTMSCQVSPAPGTRPGGRSPITDAQHLLPEPLNPNLLWGSRGWRGRQAPVFEVPWVTFTGREPAPHSPSPPALGPWSLKMCQTCLSPFPAPSHHQPSRPHCSQWLLPLAHPSQLLSPRRLQEAGSCWGLVCLEPSCCSFHTVLTD